MRFFLFALILLFGFFFFTNIHLIAQELPSYPAQRSVFVKKSLPINDLPKTVRKARIKVKETEYGNGDSLFIQSDKIFYFYKNGKKRKVESLNLKNDAVYFTSFFDKKGRVVRQNFRSGYYTFRYDDTSFSSTKIEFDLDSTFVNKTIIKYNRKFIKPVLSKRFKEEDVVADSTTFIYNEYGDLKQKAYHNTPNGYGMSINGDFSPWPDYITSYRYSYNNAGKMTAKSKIHKGDWEEEWVYLTKNDTIISIKENIGFKQKISSKLVVKEFENTKVSTFFSDPPSKKSSEYLYRNDQLVTERRNYKNPKYNYVDYYSYKFIRNNRGQWIKRMQFKNGKLNQVINRKIEYWE